MTYYPHFELFYHVLNVMVENIDLNEEILPGIWKCFLTKFYLLNIDATTIELPLESYTMPLLHSGNYFYPTLFSILSLEKMYLLIRCMLLERSIIFYSQNLNHLTFSMYFTVLCIVLVCMN
jgi:hypothetical protein